MTSKLSGKTYWYGSLGAGKEPLSLRLTALVDYDFASVRHPSCGFLRSFDGD